VRRLTRATVRYYLHNLDGLQQEISDINADLGDYRAMVTDEFIVSRVDIDADPYRSGGNYKQLWPEDRGGGTHYNNSSHTEQLAVNRADFITKLEQELYTKKTILAAINCVLYYLGSYDRQADKQIIQLRYAEHLPWGVISKKMSYEQITLWHKDSQIVDEIISNYNARLT